MAECRLGKLCNLLPYRYIIAAVAAYQQVYSALYLAYLVVVKWLLNRSTLTPQHCSGSHCWEIVSCEGLLEATFHLNIVVFIVGGMLFGNVGLRAAMRKSASEFYVFGIWCAAKASFLVALAVGDRMYTSACQAYPYNVISEAYMWPFTDVPVTEQAKIKLHGMAVFPVGFCDLIADDFPSMAKINIWSLYFDKILPEVIILYYVSWLSFDLAGRAAWGIYGLGTNHSLSAWKQGLEEKEEMKGLMRVAKEDTLVGVRSFQDMMMGREVTLQPQDNWWPRGAPGYGYGGPPPVIL